MKLLLVLLLGAGLMAVGIAVLWWGAKVLGSRPAAPSDWRIPVGVMIFLAGVLSFIARAALLFLEE